MSDTNDIIIAVSSTNDVTTLKYVGNNFIPNQSYYTLKVKAESYYGVQEWEWRLYRSTNANIVALRVAHYMERADEVLGYYANRGTEIPNALMYYGTYGQNVSSPLDKGVSRYELISSSGNIGASMPDPYQITMRSAQSIGSNFDIDFTIDADFPIFFSDPIVAPIQPLGVDGEGYTNGDVNDDNNKVVNAVSGDMSLIEEAVNSTTNLNVIPKDKTYYIRSTLKVNGTPTTSKNYCFQIIPGTKICLYQDDNPTGNGSPNLHLIISQYPCLVKGYSDPDTDYTETSNPDTEYWHSGYWRDINTGVNYTGICSTNIPIFRGQQNAQKYLDGELSESDALNGGSFANKDSTIGGELTGSDIPTVNLSASGIGCYTYAVSEAQLKEIMGNYLFTTDSNLQQSIKDALWTWGNNPIDFMIDCYYVPFSISAFYDTINANLKFGTYQFPNTSYPAVKESNGNRFTLFNTTFEGVYGDWRDYTQFTYDLYLPFVGFFTLDNYKYLNHTVKCEMMFDLSTHNVRYYLFADGIITDRVDGSVGVNIPLMATDTVNKAKHDRDTKYGLVNDSLKLAGSVGQLAAGDIGGAASGVNTVISGIKKYEDLQTKPSSSVEGSFSSSMNIYDISYAYLRITEKQLIIPDKLNQLYNYPSYYMGSASQLSGYCEISDIRLNGFTGTVDEMEQLKRDLMEGVIL